VIARPSPCTTISPGGEQVVIGPDDSGSVVAAIAPVAGELNLQVVEDPQAARGQPVGSAVHGEAACFAAATWQLRLACRSSSTIPHRASHVNLAHMTDRHLRS
jgi:hypothetical protein